MAANGKVLLVDDSKLVLEKTGTLLRDAGYEVETADNIWIAPVVNRFKPDLILMDVDLVTSDGSSGVRVLKKQSAFQHIKMVLYSAKPPGELAQIARDNNADGYIPKSDSDKIFLQHVRTFLE